MEREDGEIDRDGEKWGDTASVDKKVVVEQVKLVRRSQCPVSRRFPNLPISPCPDSSAGRDADYAGTVVRVEITHLWSDCHCFLHVSHPGPPH